MWKVACVLGFGLVFGQASRAMACEEEGQWASKVLGFSTQYGTGSWSADQLLGPCNEPGYKDSGSTWNASGQDSGKEWVEVEFPEAVYPSGVIIRETFVPGFIRKIELKLLNGTYVTVWEGTSYPTTANQPNDTRFLWETLGELSKVVKITTDTKFALGKYESIDSVQLLGPPTYH